MILQTLIKIRVDRAEAAILIAHFWPARQWFTLLQHMAVYPPMTFPLKMNLLSQTLQDKGTLFHDGLAMLNLVAWKRRAVDGETEVFVRKSCRQ